MWESEPQKPSNETGADPEYQVKVEWLNAFLPEGIDLDLVVQSPESPHRYRNPNEH